jgi:hypothetical protein
MWIPDRPVVVVEPHADDAFLSLGGHLVEWVKRRVGVTICTVYSGTRRRGYDAGAYAAHIGADWIGLGWVEGDSMDGPVLPRLLEPGDIDDLPGVPILPLGLRHVEHLAVANARLPGGLAYVDQPYASKPTMAGLVTARLRGAEVVSWCRPRASKYGAARLFKDQARYFYMNPPEDLYRAITEVVVRPAAGGARRGPSPGRRSGRAVRGAPRRRTRAGRSGSLHASCI